MNAAVRLPGRYSRHALLIATAAVPLTGWAAHALTLHKRLAATRKDPLTGLLRRDAYTARARRLLTRHGDDLAVVMVDADHVDRTNADEDGVSQAPWRWRPVRDIQPTGGEVVCPCPTSTVICGRFTYRPGVVSFRLST